MHGVDLDPPQAHVVAPPVSVFQLPGNTRVAQERLRRRASADLLDAGHDGRRRCTGAHPLRLACDLGRLRPRDQASARWTRSRARPVLTAADIEREIPRFRGMRGVIQLRDLAPRVDGRAMSPPESWVRLRCQDGGLPELTRRWRYGAAGSRGRASRCSTWRTSSLRFAVEYDGDDWHTSDDQRAHDRRRRGWLTREES